VTAPIEATAAKPVRWNFDKPHRCPACHAAAVDMDPHPTSWWIYTCCRCGVRFTRWPRLAWLLPNAGIRCTEHRTEEPRS